jgi:hypothetical protein
MILKMLMLASVIAFESVIKYDVLVSARAIWNVVKRSRLFAWLADVNRWVIAALPGVWLAAIVIALLVEPSIVEDYIAIATVTIAIILIPNWS